MADPNEDESDGEEPREVCDAEQGCRTEEAEHREERQAMTKRQACVDEETGEGQLRKPPEASILDLILTKEEEDESELDDNECEFAPTDVTVTRFRGGSVRMCGCHKNVCRVSWLALSYCGSPGRR